MRDESDSVTVALGLGSNLGRREQNLQWAIAELRRVLRQVQVAPLLETPPMSAIPQPRYLNTAMVGLTRLDPDQLLATCKQLERQAGRILGERNSPRPLDIDLLLYGDAVSDRPELRLPHPGLAQRRFVLEPLAGIAPDLVVPPDGATIAELLARLPPDI